MIDEKKIVKAPHNLILENRKNLMGELSIKGAKLHINKFSVENGELNVEGDISSLIYSNVQENQGGFFSKLFR